MAALQAPFKVPCRTDLLTDADPRNARHTPSAMRHAVTVTKMTHSRIIGHDVRGSTFNVKRHTHKFERGGGTTSGVRRYYFKDAVQL